MTDKIVYDRVWLEDYLNKLKQYENDMGLIRENLLHVRNNLSADSAELYLAIVQEIDEIEHNFHIMHYTVERFIHEAHIHALKLEHFSEEQYHQLLHWW